MKQKRFFPWLILVLAMVLVFAAGCDRPDPSVEMETPQPMNVPQQPSVPQTVETAVPGGETNLPPDGAATPTLPAVIEVTPGGEGVPIIEATPEPGSPGATQPEVPTIPPPQPTPAPQIEPPPSTPQPATAQGTTVYTVKPGETLFSIGRLYNVNPYAIAAANNIPYPYVIYPGQQLTIPTGGTAPGPTPPPPSGQCRTYHQVKPGENLYRISLAYGVPMATIASANGIVNYNLIYAGQTLCIP
jgi:LysM repeat protein